MPRTRPTSTTTCVSPAWPRRSAGRQRSRPTTSVLSLDDTIADRLPDLPAAWGGHPSSVVEPRAGFPTSRNPRRSSRRSRPRWRRRCRRLTCWLRRRRATELPPHAAVPLLQLRQHHRRIDDRGGDGESRTRTCFAQEVLEPLGLDDTSLPAGTELPEPYMHGYRLNEEASRWMRATSPLLVGVGVWRDRVDSGRPERLHPRLRRRRPVRRRCARTAGPFIPGGLSDPNGPGDGSASMALFRYQTECGTVYGHSGNIFGYRQPPSPPDGRRSVTSSISLQRTQKNEGQDFSVQAQVRLGRRPSAPPSSDQRLRSVRRNRP